MTNTSTKEMGTLKESLEQLRARLKQAENEGKSREEVQALYNELKQVQYMLALGAASEERKRSLA